MDYKDAKNLISKKYIIENLDENTCEIITRKMVDDFNTSFLALVKTESGCKLSDFAKTCEITDIEEETLKSLAEKHHLIFDDYYIVTPFNSMDDLNNFLEFFDDIAKLNEN